MRLSSCSVRFRFQPTLPLRGATRLEGAAVVEELVSTHAPLAGSDSTFRDISRMSRSFQPTLPLRGATDESQEVEGVPQVSTHAPLAGSDGLR